MERAILSRLRHDVRGSVSRMVDIISKIKSLALRHKLVDLAADRRVEIRADNANYPG